MKKTAIVHQIFAHYREPIIRLLCQQTDNIEYTLFSNRENTLNTVKTVDPHLAEIPVEQGGLRWKFVKNIALPCHLLWQKGILRLALSNEYDCTIFSGDAHYLSTWVACLLARMKKKRILMWSHGFLRDEKGVKGWIRKRFYKLADGMLLYHNRARDIMIKKGFRPENLYVVYNSLDYNQQIQVRNTITNQYLMELRKRIFDHPDLPVLLFIGRLTAQKKLDYIIKSAKILHEQNIKCNVLFVGNGEERSNLESLTRELGLSNYVVFYRACYSEKELGPVIRMSDVCVAPGEVGLTCLHSLVYGTPVITHDNPDKQMPEYEAIRPGVNGDFFKQNDIYSLVDILKKWLTCRKSRQEIAESCYEVIDRCYNPNFQLQVINAAVRNKSILKEIP
jgi:glycosyltransferase involved in cell wall biosynthesis